MCGKSRFLLLCLVVLCLLLIGCATELPARRLALNDTSPIFDDSQLEAVEASLCEIPVLREKSRCPIVHEKRIWISADQTDVTCRLSVCGEDHVWRLSNGRWRDATLRLR